MIFYFWETITQDLITLMLTVASYSYLLRVWTAFCFQMQSYQADLIDRFKRCKLWLVSFGIWAGERYDKRNSKSEQKDIQDDQDRSIAFLCTIIQRALVLTLLDWLQTLVVRKSWPQWLSNQKPHTMLHKDQSNQSPKACIKWASTKFILHTIICSRESVRPASGM